MGEGILIGVPITEGAAFKRGVQYEVANCVKTPNLGENKVHWGDGERSCAEFDSTSLCSQQMPNERQ